MIISNIGIKSSRNYRLLWSFNYKNVSPNFFLFFLLPLQCTFNHGIHVPSWEDKFISPDHEYLYPLHESILSPMKFPNNKLSLTLTWKFQLVTKSSIDRKNFVFYSRKSMEIDISRRINCKIIFFFVLLSHKEKKIFLEKFKSSCFQKYDITWISNYTYSKIFKVLFLSKIKEKRTDVPYVPIRYSIFYLTRRGKENQLVAASFIILIIIDITNEFLKQTH